jgi:hypothetical protein
MALLQTYGVVQFLGYIIGTVWSARVGLAHRALAVEDGEDFLWAGRPFAAPNIVRARAPIAPGWNIQDYRAGHPAPGPNACPRRPSGKDMRYDAHLR